LRKLSAHRYAPALIFAVACGGVQLPQCGPGHGATDGAPIGTPSASVDDKKTGRRNERWKPTPPSATSAWRSLRVFVPDKLDGYRARSVLEGHDLTLTPDITLLTARRAYARDGVSLDLEVIDTQHGERVRGVFKRTRELSRETANAVLRPMKVQGHPALSQWTQATRVARTSVLVADRFLVNANVKPADSVTPSIDAVQKLDWAALEKLAAEPSPPTAAAVEPEQATRDVPMPVITSTTPDAPDASDPSLLASQPN
jgi:hypothetical protein